MRKLYISAAADSRLLKYFADRGYENELIGTSGIVSDPVSDHPDMFMCRLGVSDDAPVISYFDLLRRYEQTGSDLSGSGYRPLLSPGYPSEVAFNAACTGKYFIHNLKYTDPLLLSEAERLGMRAVNVRQGYAKCSTVIVDEDSVITYDNGIASECISAGMNVLRVSSGHVILEGYDSGFIGGASGRIDDMIVFNGDLSSHPDFRSIVNFIEDREIGVRWFEDWSLTDIGTIL